MSAAPRVALATCDLHPALDKDDAPLAAALAARGARVDVAPWQDARFDWGAADVVVLRSTWDYDAHLPQFFAWTERIAKDTRLWNPPDVVRWNADKRYLVELARRGVPTVPTVVLAKGERVDLRGILRARGWPEAVAKPAVGLGGYGVARVSLADADVGQAVLDGELARRDVLVQPLVASVATRGETSVILVDGKPTHAVRKVPRDGEFRVQERLGGVARAVAASAEELAVSEAALRAAPSRLLYARVDLLADDAGRPLVAELELIEPSLFLAHDPSAAARLADAILARV